MSQTSRFEGRDIARIAVFAAIIIALGLMGPIPGPIGVPITAQTLGVMLAGAVLGWRGAAASVLVVLVLAAIGLPVLSGGKGGLGVFVGPTAGYLVGWVAGAAVVGLIAHAGGRRLEWWRVALANVVGGILVIYAFGIPVQAIVLALPLGETVVASAVFLPGDLVKVVLATVLTVAVHRAYPVGFGAARPRVRTQEPATEEPATVDE
ncbi:biotin transporter BioY [Microbacterium betulae]|uniref:Biotin transporter n=1 Tax=Microbacterium betulae TaxID=2981139 RepID=A0AA97FEM5_9MICO|nr:biotin transporter BioY [Microbacterium sp. AB]WOF21728.1 biotin transporter BioY [Microbacterium sp. AB]